MHNDPSNIADVSDSFIVFRLFNCCVYVMMSVNPASGCQIPINIIRNMTALTCNTAMTDVTLEMSNGSVHDKPKKLISGDCYTIFHLISSDLKLISTSYHDFHCCIFSGKNEHVFLVIVMLSASYTFIY